MDKHLKIVVEQKVIDDTYYTNSFLWCIMDDEHKIYKNGEAKTRNEALEEGRKALKKIS